MCATSIIRVKIVLIFFNMCFFVFNYCFYIVKNFLIILHDEWLFNFFVRWNRLTPRLKILTCNSRMLHTVQQLFVFGVLSLGCLMASQKDLAIPGNRLLSKVNILFCKDSFILKSCEKTLAGNPLFPPDLAVPVSISSKELVAGREKDMPTFFLLRGLYHNILDYLPFEERIINVLSVCASTDTNAYIQDQWVKDNIDEKEIEVLRENFVSTKAFDRFMNARKYLLMKPSPKLMQVFSDHLASSNYVFISLFSVFKAHSKHYDTLFEYVFGSPREIYRDDSRIYLETILHHQLSRFMVLHQKTSSLPKHNFSMRCIKMMMRHVASSCNSTQYYSLKDAVSQLEPPSQDAFVVVCNNNRRFDRNKKYINRLMIKNPSLQIILDVDHHDAHEDERLKISPDLLGSVTNLILTNTSHNVRSLDEMSLRSTNELKSLTLSGFSGLSVIESQFLSYTKIEEFNAFGLIHLQHISKLFLCGSIHLRGCGLFGLASLVSIDDHFLFNASRIKYCYFLSVPNLKSIGNNFMFGALSLRDFDASGWINLQSIGASFLAYAEKLEYFDASGFIELKNFGDNFLMNTSRSLEIQIGRLLKTNKPFADFLASQTLAVVVL